ncbi:MULTISPECIES: hypothetical protein [unclassified Carboxylicivirga]|uniref:hypothetical protein n=1 Tax=Carboxylicivirga TaxID=1628153 RepID=UPI003D3402FE
MKLLRQILFTLVLLIILGHSSLAHSHEQCESLQQIELPEKTGFLYFLDVVVNSNTGNYHLEDYRQKRFVLKASSALETALAINAVRKEPPLIEESVFYPFYLFPFSPDFHFYSVYSLRGSPC